METSLKDSIVEEVVQKMLSRSRVGIEKYGVTLDREDLTISQWFNHSIEEKMDDLLYMTKIRHLLENDNNPYLSLIDINNEYKKLSNDFIQTQSELEELQNKFDELVRECINQKHELATKEKIIENLNKVIKSQEDEIKELNKSTHIVQKRRAWHV